MTRRLLVVVAVLMALLSPLLASPAGAAGDDYPYRGDTSARSDRWGFTTRQCTSFTAWRLEQHHAAISNYRDPWGDAGHWDDEARALGRTVSRTPKVGAVAQWNGNEKGAYYAGGGVGTFTAGSAGHVAYVVAVYSDGSVKVEQYNMSGSRSYSTMRVKAPRYLYVAG